MRTFRDRRRRTSQLALAGACVLALLFLASRFHELFYLAFTPQTNAYASLLNVLSGAMILATCVAIALNLAAQGRLAIAKPEHLPEATLQMELVCLYWYFLAGMGVVILLTLYASPHVLPK